MSDTKNTREFAFHGDRNNRKQMVMVLPAKAHDYPAVLGLQSYNGSAVLDTFFFWADSNGALRYGTEHPDSGSFNQDTDGTAVGAAAAVTLDGAFDNGKIIDGAKAAATAVKIGSTSASNYNMSLYHDDTDMHLAVNIGDLKITAQGGDVDFSNENLTTTGTINIGADDVNLTLGAAGATDSYITFKGGANLVFYDSTLGSEVTLSTLAGTNLTSPTITGDATISDGKFTWTDAVDETAGAFTFAATTGKDIDITSSITTGDVLTLTADACTTGTILKLEATEGTLNGGMYIEAYDNTGSAAVFALKEDGEIEITGTAASDMITVTAGNFQLDNGKFEVDTTQDITSYVKRNHSSSSNAVVEIEQTHASSTGSALLIDQNATGNAKGIEISHYGDYAAIDISAPGARTGNVIQVTMANQLAETALDITGACTGTASEGIIHVDVTGVLAGNAIRVDSTGANAATGNLILATSSGKQAAATNGIAAYFADTGAATATSYCVAIASTNNEALHVDAGKSLFDEQVAITLADNTGEALVITNPDTTGNTNAVSIVPSGSGAGIAITPQEVDTQGILITTVQASTVPLLDLDLTTGTGWVGAATTGAIDVTADGALAADATLLRLASSGQPAGANGGVCLEIVESGSAQATSYAVRIASTNNEALHVDAGECLFDEKITCSGGIRTKVATTDVHDTTPTDAQCDTAFGTPATVGAGFIGMINDAGGGANVYLVFSDGASWFFTTKGTACS